MLTDTDLAELTLAQLLALVERGTITDEQFDIGLSMNVGPKELR